MVPPSRLADPSPGERGAAPGTPRPICHLDGRLLPLAEARISPLDRSFLFGDGVYEVIPAPHGQARRLQAHLARLARSLAAVRIPDPHPPAEWAGLIDALMAANGGGDLYVYLQVSRGADVGRSHAPLPQLTPLVFAFCAPLPRPSPRQLVEGIACITAPDIRWARCDVKSVALLANVLLRQQSVEAGADETILLRDGWLTEASASSVCVVRQGELHLPPGSTRLLPGTTRGLIEELAAAHDIPCRAVPVSESELRAADEIWLCAATRGVLPVTRLDGQAVGDGRPGALWRRMYALMEAYWSA